MGAQYTNTAPDQVIADTCSRTAGSQVCENCLHQQGRLQGQAGDFAKKLVITAAEYLTLIRLGLHSACIRCLNKEVGEPVNLN